MFQPLQLLVPFWSLHVWPMPCSTVVSQNWEQKSKGGHALGTAQQVPLLERSFIGGPSSSVVTTTRDSVEAHAPRSSGESHFDRRAKFARWNFPIQTSSFFFVSQTGKGQSMWMMEVWGLFQIRFAEVSYHFNLIEGKKKVENKKDMRNNIASFWVAVSDWIVGRIELREGLALLGVFYFLVRLSVCLSISTKN